VRCNTGNECQSPNVQYYFGGTDCGALLDDVREPINTNIGRSNIGHDGSTDYGDLGGSPHLWDIAIYCFA